MPSRFVSVLALSLVIAGCSSRPRAFEPIPTPASAARPGFDERLLFCRQQIAAAMDKSGRLGSAVGGAAAGAGAGVAAGAATAGATYGSYGAAAAAGAAMIAVVPFAGIAGAWGIAKMKRSKKEKVIKLAMEDCLAKSGYSVADWDVLSKREAKALAASLDAATAEAKAAQSADSSANPSEE